MSKQKQHRGVSSSPNGAEQNKTIEEGHVDEQIEKESNIKGCRRTKGADQGINNYKKVKCERFCFVAAKCNDNVHVADVAGSKIPSGTEMSTILKHGFPIEMEK